jgi:microsomal dipeptidase-like Zn-dependent dipeptidase
MISATHPQTLSGEEHGGLSEFGIEVVKRMNSLGMMVDVSHISDKAFYDVLDVTRYPVIASHSNAKALCDHPRNLDDEMLLALKENGGVIQVCVLSDYVKTPAPNPPKEMQHVRKCATGSIILQICQTKKWRKRERRGIRLMINIPRNLQR